MGGLAYLKANETVCVGFGSHTGFNGVIQGVGEHGADIYGFPAHAAVCYSINGEVYALFGHFCHFGGYERIQHLISRYYLRGKRRYTGMHILYEMLCFVKFALIHQHSYYAEVIAYIMAESAGLLLSFFELF